MQTYTRTKCGFAAVNIITGKHDDRMDSFFLSETLKYLYLIFDEENSMNSANIVFTTEGHIIPIERVVTPSTTLVQACPRARERASMHMFSFAAILTDREHVQAQCDPIDQSLWNLINAIPHSWPRLIGDGTGKTQQQQQEQKQQQQQQQQQQQIGRAHV